MSGEGSTDRAVAAPGTLTGAVAGSVRSWVPGAGRAGSVAAASRAVRAALAAAAPRARRHAGPVGRVLFARTERERRRRRLVGCCLPFLVLATVAGFYPLVELARISVSEARFAAEGFSLSAYGLLVDSTRAFLAAELRELGLGGVAGALAPAGDVTATYGAVAVNTLWFSVATTVASVAVAVPVAHGLAKYDLPRSGLLVTLASFPISLPGIVAAFMIIVLLGNTGLLTNAFAAMAVADPTDAAVATGVAGLFLAYLYSMVPRALLLLRGTYAEVNAAAEEAARSLGATPWQTFRHVTLPQITPGLIGAAILTFRTALAIFGTLLVLQALNLWTLQIDRTLSTGYDVQVAGAMAVVWFLFVFGFTYAGLRFTSAEVGL